MTGPERIAAAFGRARDDGRAALVVYLAAGDPDYETTVQLARAAADAGADLIELGVPFSDPLADGPVIQAAYTRALEAGATAAGTLECARRVVTDTDAPVVLMASLNPLLAYGLERFCADAAAAGVSGLLVPDLPVDDADELQKAAADARLGVVFLAAPDSPPARVAAAARASTGFVYLLRRRGITGAGVGAVGLVERVAALRAAGSSPVAVGFGIATPGDAAQAAGVADGVIVGSVLVHAAYEAGRDASDPDEARRRAAGAVADRVRGFVGALGRRPATTTGGGVE